MSKNAKTAVIASVVTATVVALTWSIPLAIVLHVSFGWVVAGWFLTLVIALLKNWPRTSR